MRLPRIQAGSPMVGTGLHVNVNVTWRMYREESNVIAADKIMSSYG